MRFRALAYVVTVATVGAMTASACSAETMYRVPDTGAAADESAPDEEAPFEEESVPEADAEAPIEDDGAPPPIDARPDVATARDAGPDVVDAITPMDVVRMDAPPDAPAPVDVVAPRDVADVVAPRDVPTTGTCRERLTALGITYTAAGATRGIEDPVTVRSPINGVNFRYAAFTASPGNMLMDCRLGLALYALTRYLRDEHDVTDVVHLGVYNYRCIAGTDPCQLSQHARAMAIDLNAFRNSTGQTFSVTTQFQANGRPTCPPRTVNSVDAMLKDVACWMYDSRTFAIILTPNYNADHRDHFHVDLTEDSHFVGFGRPMGVDPESAPGVIESIFDDY
jgi:hypothetical protein